MHEVWRPNDIGLLYGMRKEARNDCGHIYLVDTELMMHIYFAGACGSQYCAARKPESQ